MSNQYNTEIKRSNVIWIFGDQHRAQALGCSEDPNVNTPNIDNLAASGVHFTQAVAGIPLCCPCRGSLLTGLYPHLAVPGHEYRLPPEQPTIAHVMNEAGYKTAYFGKWHLDGFKEDNGRAAFHIIPRSGAAASATGSAMRTITASGTVGFTAAKARMHSITACPATRRTR
ncbi:sulfatase-like hydrolase/transferase [Paenibacillus sp. D2_2]|uniref:sulfatase-like hydrolase/transferase n=1 Tax=Paenibacillus sp. D2_2 TaxID=3073092 RepID=UPI002815A73E|nr:sulfatase-like hydrolase/transferase [Paenibacillus sp. D2_2]WMT41775.1 sulfatase-like hydrolase/transferase [Paenibacillus sp. D2_2]